MPPLDPAETPSEPRELSLSELCSICRAVSPKYTCPRCTAQTCSLQCSQRHKRWASCSGQRDPTTYVRRRELATPRMFDNDFNFLSGVERAVERAERIVGVGVGAELKLPTVGTVPSTGSGGSGGRGGGRGAGRGGGKGKSFVAVKGEVPFLKGVEKSEVRLVRAPRGMERQRRNQSGWRKKQRCISWSVEWVFPDGKTETNKMLETRDVGSGFAATAWAKARGQEVKEGEDGPRKKRKIEIETETTPAASLELKPEQEGENDIAQRDDPDDRSSSGPASPGTLTPEPEEEQQPTKPNEKEELQHPGFRFYLHRPRARSKLPVLIPLKESTTLAAALRGRTVLEFPTLYVLDANDGINQEKYVLEERYLADHPEEREAADESSSSGDDDDEDEAGPIGAALKTLEGLDETKVLEVLKQDLCAE